MNASERGGAWYHAPEGNPSRRATTWTLFDVQAMCRRCGAVVTEVPRRCVWYGHYPAPRVRVTLDDGAAAFHTWRELARQGVR
jgi:hypothetical protein